MIKPVHGRIHGKTIELDEDLGIADGQEVEVTVTPARPQRPWGEGIKRSAGAAVNDPDFEGVFEQIANDRKSATFREAKS